MVAEELVAGNLKTSKGHMCPATLWRAAEGSARCSLARRDRLMLPFDVGQNIVIGSPLISDCRPLRRLSRPAP